MYFYVPFAIVLYDEYTKPEHVGGTDSSVDFQKDLLKCLVKQMN